MCEKSQWIKKMIFIKGQIKETVEQDAKGVTVRMATITCGCGWKRSLMLQRLYCKEYFCINCAEVHFGKTVKQYREENPIPEIK